MRGRQPPASGDGGFSLVEVLVAMLLTAILVMGLVSAWSVLGNQFFRLTLQQKAVFALHGHMERIAALYRSGGLDPAGTGTYSVNAATSGYSSSLTAHNGLDRVILTSGPNSLLVSGSASTLTDVGQILHYDPSAAASERNVIWLDLDRRITARLSWVLDDSGMPAGNCYWDAVTDQCQELTLYLDFPYRFPSGASDPLQEIENLPSQTLTLKTIVGRRY